MGMMNLPATETDSVQEPDLEAAMRGIANGDREQFRILHDHLFNLVVGTAYRVLNDRHDAEDVAQEVFTNLWTKAKLFDSRRGKPKTWLGTMARNRAIDRLRSKQRRSQLRDELVEEVRPEELREKHDVLATVSQDEEALVLRSAVMKLSDEQREAIEMTYFSGFSQSQAAERLGAPLGTVKARIRRGIIRLRTLVPELIDEA